MSQMPMPPDFTPFGGEGAPPPPSRKKSGLITAVLTLTLILAVAVILHESLLKIHHVAVVGNEQVTWQEVVDAAGLSRGVSYFAVSEEKIAAGINADHRLVFERLEKQFPDSVTLYVRERRETIFMQIMGVGYILDDEGMVMRRLASDEKMPSGLIVVTGFKVRDVRVGRIIMPTAQDYMDVFLALMEEIRLQGIRSEISELNVSDPDSLYLITADGYTAHLGDRTDLRAKIGTVRAVVTELRAMEKFGGMLEASRPGEATYTPAGP